MTLVYNNNTWIYYYEILLIPNQFLMSQFTFLYLNIETKPHCH